MMNAYDKVYLEKARTALGRMLDFAVHDLGYSLETFYGLFWPPVSQTDLAVVTSQSSLVSPE